MTTELRIATLEWDLKELQKKYEVALSILSAQSVEITELKAQVALFPVIKTSKNSHLPPSVDLSRKNQSLREKSDKPVGGQKGHLGHTLKMSETPDKIEKLYAEYCNKCGLSLSDAEFELVARRQVIDIPPIVPIITEFQKFSTICTCGHHQCGTFPEGVSNHVQYGENIQSLVVYQSCYQFMPFGRLQDFFKKICSVDISKGTIENIIRRTAKKSEHAYETLRQVVAVSFFVGSDETGFKVNKSKFWFWVWQNSFVTFIVAACSRSKKVISDYFPEGLPNTILCSDRLAAQLSTITKGMQICLVHLLRDLNYLITAEGHENMTWATDFKTLLKDAIKLKQLLPAYNEKDDKVLNIEQRVDKLLDPLFLEELLKEPVKYHQTIVFFRAMVKLRHALFPFLYHKLVPFDNNGSERAIRMVKVKTKISGQFKSLHQEFAIIRSIIDTSVKNGKSAFHAIKAMVGMPAIRKATAAG